MNKFEEAVTSYQKALDLDPENDSYKSNLKIAEQKLREVSSPVSCLCGTDPVPHNWLTSQWLEWISALTLLQTGTGLSFDMASLINNPAFITMVSILLSLLIYCLLSAIYLLSFSAILFREMEFFSSCWSWPIALEHKWVSCLGLSRNWEYRLQIHIFFLKRNKHRGFQWVADVHGRG